MPLPAEELAVARRHLCSLSAVRERCGAVLALAERGEALHFELDEGRCDEALRAISVAAMELSRSAATGFGRLRHLDADGQPRSRALAARLDELASLERARSYVDLVLPSVLLDAGAGPDWRYVDEGGSELRRSEGLAVASLRLFEAGGFGGDAARPRCDAEGLGRLDRAALARALQLSDRNPIVGLEGRARTLAALASILRARPDMFGPGARAGALVDVALAAAGGACTLDAERLFAPLAEALAPLWPEGASLGGAPLGDVWAHPALGSGAAGLVPLHKLTQWLVRSLVEPLAIAGVEVTGLGALTPLADYRNAGLLVDVGALRLRDPREASAPLAVSHPLVVEWRALSVAVLDRLSARLGSTSENASALRVGLFDTAAWHAGRKLAAERRPGGAPPILVASDGTVF